MKAKFYTFKNLIIILMLFPLIHSTKAQDSLYLVGTITGESYEHRICAPTGIGDINGDGYDDFIISMRTGNLIRDQGIIKLYFGSANFDLNADVIFHYPGSDLLNDFGGGYPVGNVNNDGYDDFVLTGVFGDWGFPKGKVFLFYGGETIDTIPVTEFYQPNAIQDGFGYPTVGLGDINKDGYDDFGIGSIYNWTDGKGYVYLFYGGDTISWDKSITFTSDILEDGYGWSLSNIGDINNDYFEDLAIGAPGGLTGNPDTGRVFIYYGATQMDNIPDTILTSDNPGDSFGSIIKNAQDLNADGITDFCINRNPYIFIYTFGLVNPIMMNSGNIIDTGGDINKDGYSDIIIGDDWEIKIYLGSGSFDTTYDLSVNDLDSVGFAANASFGGDINNDGYDEIFAAANFPDPENPVGKVFIFSYNKPNNVNDEMNNYPNRFRLYQNYPNPFNPVTSINYQLESRAYIYINIYDVLGKEIATLVNEEKPSGNYKTEFDALKYKLSSGTYFCELKIKGGGSSIIKMVLVK